MRWWIPAAGTEMLQERLLNSECPRPLPFALVSDLPTAAARDVRGWRHPLSTGREGSEEGGGIRTTPLFTLSGLSRHAVSRPFLEGATCQRERAASLCWHLYFPRAAVTVWHSLNGPVLLVCGCLPAQTCPCDKTAGNVSWTDWKQPRPALHLGADVVRFLYCPAFLSWT